MSADPRERRGAQRARRRWLGRGLAWVVVLLGGVVLAEGLVRLFAPQANPFGALSLFASDPHTGYVLAPNGLPAEWGGVERHGMRGPALDDRPREGRLRVAFLGDSFTFGVGTFVDSFPAATGRALAARLALEPERVDVVNAGVPGFCLADYAPHLEHHVLALAPHAVVAGIQLGDDLNAVPDPEVEVIDGYLVSGADARAGRLPRAAPWEGLHLVRLVGRARRLAEWRRYRERPERCLTGESLEQIEALVEARRQACPELAARLCGDRDAFVRGVAGAVLPTLERAGPARAEARADVFTDADGDRLARRLTELLDAEAASGRGGGAAGGAAKPVPGPDLRGGTVDAPWIVDGLCPLVAELVRERGGGEPGLGPEEAFVQFLADEDPGAGSGPYLAASTALERLVELAHARSLPLVLVAIPPRIAVDRAMRARALAALGLDGRAFDWDRPRRWLAGKAMAAGVPLVDLSDPFAARIAGGEELYLRFDGHWNVAGQALAAELVVPALARALEASPALASAR